ncbi:MAG: DUF3626 domain-containing protein [Candidatus Wallbacteria bacterium HGW-Wallbacteria-1]|uniref:DUF3626 domain-containing protein n=1 Tax=Candidatus Wallbacteria bacterium HGW-Wallbacteria-1 TaxID=2013854 RepID=A0A2N1PKU2_9BACT|nr:MAG: DUF3626 domain-containing protein [Candidatus Wallbacteria bacterium HGW-Wallbacteria-1]
MADSTLINQVLNFIKSNFTGYPSEIDFPVTMNFHPDHLTRTGEPLLSAIAREGRLKSQFETGTSNGGLTAHPDGDRWKWESAAFNGLYNHCAPETRPKYGALDYLMAGSGGSPRFGSAHFRLMPHVTQRTTFCFPDSYFNPLDFAVNQHVGKLIDLSRTSNLDPVDNYIEAHIHGQVRIDRDVEALVLDPSYAGTETEKLARALPCCLEWHSGFSLHIDIIEQNPHFRGHEYFARAVAITEKFAADGIITPPVLSAAAGTGLFHHQELKKIWHYLARFGFEPPTS